jgi:hypothetical protein
VIRLTTATVRAGERHDERRAGRSATSGGSGIGYKAGPWEA